MELGFLLTVSCVLTTISMIVLIGVILFFARFGGQGVKMLIDRVMGGNDDKQKEDVPARTGRVQTAVASSQSLRQRANQLDFPAPAGASGVAQFGAQSASQPLGQNNYPDFPAPQNQGLQQASLRPRGQYPEFNPQATQASNPSQGFQPSTPSLSASRPFQAGSTIPRPTQQNQSFGQQHPPQQNNFNQGNQLGQPAPPNQFGRQPAQPPNQGLPPLQGNPQGFSPQGLPPQQPPAPQPPQFGGLGENRPPLRSLPRPDDTANDRPLGGRDRRQSDDRDFIYDERSGGNFMDEVGDFLDNV